MKQYGDIHAKKMLRSNIDQNCIIGSDGTISWLGLMVNDKEQLEYAMLDWSLYSGIILCKNIWSLYVDYKEVVTC